MIVAAAATVEAGALALVLAQADSPVDPTSLKALGLLAPFFSLLVWMLYRESKKRDEAESLVRQLYQVQMDKTEPAMRAMQNEMAAVLRDAVREIAESKTDRQQARQGRCGGRGNASRGPWCRRGTRWRRRSIASANTLTTS